MTTHPLHERRQNPWWWFLAERGEDRFGAPWLRAAGTAMAVMGIGLAVVSVAVARRGTDTDRG